MSIAEGGEHRESTALATCAPPLLYTHHSASMCPPAPKALTSGTLPWLLKLQSSTPVHQTLQLVPAHPSTSCRALHAVFGHPRDLYFFQLHFLLVTAWMASARRPTFLLLTPERQGRGKAPCLAELRCAVLGPAGQGRLGSMPPSQDFPCGRRGVRLPAQQQHCRGSTAALRHSC